MKGLEKRPWGVRAAGSIESAPERGRRTVKELAWRSVVLSASVLLLLARPAVAG
jgi:hypothetical protein